MSRKHRQSRKEKGKEVFTERGNCPICYHKRKWSHTGKCSKCGHISE